MHRLIQQIAKFGVVGVVATVIDFGLLTLLTELAGWDPVVAAGVSFVVSLLFNYALSMRYVFRHREDISRAREVALFFVLSVIGLGLNELIMALGVNGAGLNYLWVKVAATAFVMVWNFVSRKLWLDAPEEEK